MQDQNLENVSQEENPDVDYIEAIKKLKENTVSKEDFNKVKEENKKLLNAVLNDQKVEQPERKKTVDELKADYKKLKLELSHAQEDGITNLEYVDKALKLRNTAMNLGLPDPFVPNSSFPGPDDNDFNTAQKVADKLQECVDEANGNPAVFRNLFEQAVRDDSKLPINNSKKRR